MIKQILRRFKNFAVEIADIHESDKVGAFFLVFMISACFAMLVFVFVIPFLAGGWWGFVIYGCLIAVIAVVALWVKFLVWYGNKQ